MKKKEVEKIENVKKLVIKSLVVEDDLVEKLVFKGGSIISLFYDTKSNRGSIDIDISIDNPFADVKRISETINRNLIDTFREENYYVYDFEFEERPIFKNESTSDFWVGYELKFKVVESDVFDEHKENIQTVRNRSITMLDGTKTFKVDISCYEYCKAKTVKNLDGYTLYIYTAPMIVAEKIRAICQQMIDYKTISKSNKRKPRAKDYYDIYTIMDTVNIDMDELMDLIPLVFEAKRVPISYLSRLEEDKEFHETGFKSVIDTISDKKSIKTYEEYFSFVNEKFGNLYLEVRRIV